MPLTLPSTARPRLVPRSAVRTPLLLHLRLVEVPPAAGELVPRALLELLEQRVVAVVVLLDHLEGPATLQDVAADELPLDPVSQVGVPGFAEEVYGLAERQVGGPATAVEGVEEA